MAKVMQTTRTGLTRIFASFGRRNDRQDPPRRGDQRSDHWYDCVVSSRGP
jgi:hypothetical protein